VPTAGKDKVIRAQPMLAGAEAGIISYFIAEWNREFLTEFDEFPAGRHDDQVDTVAAAYTKLTGKRVYSATSGHKATLTEDARKIALTTMQKRTSERIRAAGHKSAIISQRRATWG